MGEWAQEERTGWRESWRAGEVGGEYTSLGNAEPRAGDTMGLLTWWEPRWGSCGRSGI